MGALAAVLIPLIPSIINGVEAAFKGVPKSGETKLQAAIRMLAQVPEAMINAKAPLPDGTQVQPLSVSDDFLKGLVQAEFQRLSATGTLGNSSAGATLFIVRGTIVPIPA